MKTKIYIKVFCLLVVFVTFAIPAKSQNVQDSAYIKEYRAALNDYLEASGTKNTVFSMVPKIGQLMKTDYPSVSDKIWTRLCVNLNNGFQKKMVDIYLPIFRKYVSLEDLKAIAVFFNSPAGKNFAEASPKLAADGMEAGKKLGAEIAEELIRELEKEGYAAKTM